MVEELAAGWQNVVEHLSENPSYVFHLLFDAEEFLFAKNLTEKLKDSNLKSVSVTAVTVAVIHCYNYLYHIIQCHVILLIAATTMILPQSRVL